MGNSLVHVLCFDAEGKGNLAVFQEIVQNADFFHFSNNCKRTTTVLRLIFIGRLFKHDGTTFVPNF